jgi:hypothetical protein
MHTLSSTIAFKIIENHNGKAYILQSQQIIVPNGLQQLQQIADPNEKNEQPAQQGDAPEPASPAR